MCNCQTESSQAQSATTHTVNAAQVANYLALSQQGLVQLASAAAPHISSDLSAVGAAEQKVTSYIHTTSQGDVLVSSTYVQDVEGDIDLHGTLGSFPFDACIKVSVKETKVSVTLQIKKPIAAGPYTWHFNLGGVTRNSAGEITGATSVTLSPETEALELSALPLWCIAKCGGAAIIPAIVSCLPSIAGGPAAFVTCLVANLGGDFAEIAACIYGCF